MFDPRVQTTPALVLSLLLAGALLPAPARAQTVRVYAIDVGQGSSTLIVGPTGKTMLIDGGPDQAGWITSPSGPGPVAQTLNALGLGQLDFTLLTHYHSDHYEGITELAQHNYLKPAAKAYDRGNVPAPEGGFTSPINAYISAMGSRRTSIALGEVVDLGGGCVVQCLVKAGSIFGGPTIDTSSSAQEENSNSIAVRLTYGNFEMYVGGDLTGGGGSTTNVEGPAGPFVGDVDVYVADHHGSSTSSNAAFVGAILPEVSIVSCGESNSFNHPSGTYLNNVNTAARSILVFGTTKGTENDGFGHRGYVNSGGTIAIETDGNAYVLTPATGPSLKIACDEVSASFPGPLTGDLRISEYLADPNAGGVPDSAGEWFEFTNVSGFERNLAGLKISNISNTELFTLATPVLMKPGSRFVVANGGDFERNGGVVAQHSEPFSVFALGNSGDSIRLRNVASVLVDEVSFTTAWPDSTGVAAQRISLLGTNVQSNWTAATATYGLGDKGTPGARNTADATVFPAAFVSASPLALDSVWTIHVTSFNEPNDIYLIALSESTSAPLLTIEGQTFPVQADGLFFSTLELPGFLWFLDADGFAQVPVYVPNNPALHGYPFFGSVGIFDNPTIAPGKVSTAVPLTIP
jgi:beta-lactamase superfamily II metal-dependent hydrolase